MSKLLASYLESCIPESHRWKLELFKHWESIIGSMKDKVSIQKIDNNTLYLAACHPAWAQELSLLAPLLKKNINRLISEAKIKNIKFCSPTSLPNQHKRKQKNSYPSFEIPTFLTEKENGLLSSINNNELSNVLSKYFNRCKSIQKRKV